MLARLAADATLLLHLGFLLFALFGAVLALRWRWLIMAHLPAVAWGTLVELADWPCPLTPWEEYFRLQALVAGCDSSPIEQMLVPLIYPAGLTAEARLLLGLALLLFNLALYLGLLRRLVGRKGDRADTAA